MSTFLSLRQGEAHCILESCVFSRYQRLLFRCSLWQFWQYTLQWKVWNTAHTRLLWNIKMGILQGLDCEQIIHFWTVPSCSKLKLHQEWIFWRKWYKVKFMSAYSFSSLPLSTSHFSLFTEQLPSIFCKDFWQIFILSSPEKCALRKLWMSYDSNIHLQHGLLVVVTGFTQNKSFPCMVSQQSGAVVENHIQV